MKTKFDMGNNTLTTHENGNEVLADISNSAVRPPLGLVPKWVRQKERYYEVCGAIARYYDAGKKIPIEWVEEYNELVEHCC